MTVISALACMGLVVVTFSVLQFSQGLPDANGIRQIELKVPLRVYSADGLLISEFGNERRIPVDYSDTPQALIEAVLASEDDNFFNHLGVDAFGLVRAALANFSSGRTGQGASTITMQVARNFYLSPEKTYTRKIKEILLAIRLEQVLTKQEILSLYLNKIFLGHRAYGFGAAAEAYYGKSLAQLNLAQIAMLAGLPKAPSSYNPIRNPERATIRRDYVLKRMRSLEWISDEAYDEAKSQPVTAKRHARDVGLNAPHIAEMVRAQLIEKYGDEVYWQGLNVYTTVISDKQVAATAALRKGLQAYDKRHGYRGPVANINLSELGLGENGMNEEAYENVLRQYPDSQEQTPAIVLSLSEPEQKTAQIWSREAGLVTLNFASSRWAKKHIDANRVGSPLKSLDQILSLGDVIYIKPLYDLGATQDNSEDTGSALAHTSTLGDNPTAQTAPVVKEWALSQIPTVSGSIVSMNPHTGAIISLVGGYDFFLNKYNRATQSIRQPGSNIKPFIYSASLEKGFTPASLISGAPIVLTDETHGTRWRPQNYSGKFFGPTRMRVALSKSMNLVSIRLLRAIGIPFARDYVARFGIDMTRFSNSLTMALGSGGVKPIEMISAYATLANGGYRIKPYFIDRITDRNGQPMFEALKPSFCDECIAEYFPQPKASLITNMDLIVEDIEDIEPDANQTQGAVENAAPEDTSSDVETSTYNAPRVMTHANNFLTVSMLKDVVSRGTARKALALERTDLAGKTGTTNDYVDAWFSGFNSQVVTTVWVGFDQPRSMGRGEAGSLTALPIWVDYMKTGLTGIAENRQTLPAYIESGFVDRNTGLRTHDGDPMATPEFFVFNELTPEYALRQQGYDLSGESGLINREELLEAAPDRDASLDGGNPLDNDFDGNTGLDGSGLYREPLTPEERIIESKEDTDGLF